MMNIVAVLLGLALIVCFGLAVIGFFLHSKLLDTRFSRIVLNIELAVLGLIAILAGILTALAVREGEYRWWHPVPPLLPIAFLFGLMANARWCRDTARRIPSDLPEDQRGESLRRLRRRLWAPLVLTPAFLVGLPCAFELVSSQLPVKRTITFVFETSDGVQADVYLNDVKVGQTPFRMGYPQLQDHFLPALKPVTWPPPTTTGYSNTSDGGWRFDIAWVPDPLRPGEILFYVHEVEKGKTTSGGVRLRVVDADGVARTCNGSGGESRGGFGSTTVTETFIFDRPY